MSSAVDIAPTTAGAYQQESRDTLVRPRGSSKEEPRRHSYLVGEGGDFVDAHERTTKTAWYHLVPVFNIIYDLFLDVPPTVDQLRESLNLIGLLSALMLTVYMVLPFSYSLDDYYSAVHRLNNMTIHDERDGKVYLPGEHQYGTECYEYFVRSVNRSTVLAAGSLMGVAWLFFGIAHTSFRGPDGRISSKMATEWWKWARWLSMYSFACLCFSALFCLNAQQALQSFMLPRDLYEPGIVIRHAGRTFNIFARVDDAGHIGNAWSWTVGIFPLFFGILFLSIGQSKKTKLYAKLALEAAEIPKEQPKWVRAMVEKATERSKGITIAQIDTATNLLSSLRYEREDDLVADFGYIDWKLDCPQVLMYFALTDIPTPSISRSVL